MAVYKNVAGQRLAVFAYNSTDGSPKTGDAANITAQISLDGGATAATNDVNPTELDATDAPGIYIFDLTQAETNADLIVVFPVSSTADIEIDPSIIYTTPGTNVGVLALLAPVTHTSAVVPTVTNLTNLPTIPNNWLTAAGIAAGALNGKGDWMASYTQPTGFLAADFTRLDATISSRSSQATQDVIDAALDTVVLAVTVDGVVVAAGSKTGYSLTNLTVSAGTTLASGTHNPQSGDAFARIGANGAGLTALGDTRLSNLDATVSSRASQASVDTIDDIVDDILVDTGTTLPATLSTIAGYLDTEIAAILEDTGTTLPAQIAALNNLSTAQVLTQCTAALETAISELSGVPSATPTTKQALMFLYMALRNRTTTTASAQTVQNDAGTTIATATLTDDGTTMTKGEFA